MKEEIEKIRRRKLEQMQKKLICCSKIQNYPNRPIKLTDTDFDGFIKKYPLVVIDCWAPWCRPCRVLAPIIDELAKEYKGKIVFGKLNVDEQKRTARKYRITSIPTILIFKNGTLVDQEVGAMPRERLEARITKHL